ncbi:hypothetical protein ISF_06476 [Cordyceps fumosorosea ARSEF 2679]|uniref:Uncharacterized protein n=1 Tax=Cordyceps fumosorosea (strain ARSEF 2679) TaxID=1081104 RepID=A0A167RKV5_CORFA|nr:hypothetical protein ISF_06476 [Cordyceps fumosorosea ARSEF 2679]OAA58693.1 hypothetical protein ISF_06476 [Cordyceps fumosorosea ARSEF 2679]
MSTSITTTLASLTPTAVSTTPLLNGTNFTTGANATANLTVLVLPQLTTQFVPPSQCTPVKNWTAATVSYTLGDSEGNTTYPQILVPVTNAQYSACQPSGWNNINSSYLFSYSKAVCPSGYNYNQLSDLFNNQPNTETIRTTAYCCPSGFSYSMFYERDIIGISGGNCMKTITLTPTTAQTTPTTTATDSSTARSASVSATTKSASIAARNATSSPPLTPGPSVVTMFYQPWFIEWEKKDASELSPSPPVVSVQYPVKTWEPGTEIDPSLTRKQTNPDALDKGLGQIIGIVVGCIAAAFAGISAVALWFCVRSRRKERQAFEREEHQLQEQRLQRIGEYQRSRSPTDDEPLPVYVKAREQDKATVAGVAVPPYKERPSSESSRHSHQQDYQNTSEGRNDIHQDTDGLTIHDQHTLEHSAPNNSTQAHSGGNRRH